MCHPFFHARWNWRMVWRARGYKYSIHNRLVPPSYSPLRLASRAPPGAEKRENTSQQILAHPHLRVLSISKSLFARIRGEKLSCLSSYEFTRLLNFENESRTEGEESSIFRSHLSHIWRALFQSFVFSLGFRAVTKGEWNFLSKLHSNSHLMHYWLKAINSNCSR